MPKQIHPRDVADRIRSGQTIYLLDVRNPWEDEYCRIDGGTLIPLPELPERLDEVQPPPGAMIVVYCHHGVRSLSGAAILESAGHTPAYSMAGGIDAWSMLIDPSVPRYQ